MHVVVTGGAGFLGQQLIARLLQGPGLSLDGAQAQAIRAITALDVAPGALNDSRLEYRSADLSAPGVAASLLQADTRLVVHLAAVVSGSAEADFDLGMRVNLDGTRALLEACRALGSQPRVVFTSSIAVFGGDLPDIVTDATMPTPQGSYGTQKLIGELLVQDFSRKGFIDGRSVRVPTVVVRPGKPNGAASGFASGIIREPLAGVPAVLPVDPSTVMWIASPDTVVEMLMHTIMLDATAWGWCRSINLPGLSASMAEELDALLEVGGPGAVALVNHRPDPAISRLVSTWAGRFDTSRALAMGYRADPSVLAIVQAYARRYGSA
jgi:nucleoside-diphosphate-sugar epimerase